MNAMTRSAAAILGAMLPLAPLAAQSAPGWPAVFSPFVVRTIKLDLNPIDWDTIRHDATNTIEVPAWFRADGESALQVLVRRKSSRALPSELDPLKVGLKIDINDLVPGQHWNGLVKLSLENAGDVHVLREGMAWQLHQMASQSGFYGPEANAALANWVRVEVNGVYVGLYTSVEQRDKQFLRNRGIFTNGATWMYEYDDIDSPTLEVGAPHSPAFTALCYPPFAPAVKRAPAACRTPSDSLLEATLDGWIELDAMLAQGAVDAFIDNPDGLFSHGKNFFFLDFAAASGRKRVYIPWDLDAVFRGTTASIYGKAARRGVSQTSYQSILLNHPGIRARYNQRIFQMFGSGGALSADSIVGMLDALEPVLANAIDEDPYILEDAAQTFASMRTWVRARAVNVVQQATANGPPAPR